MQNSVLRKLEDYGMRTSYMILLLQARSSSQFQRAHDRIIPSNCRLPRAEFLALKQEWKQNFESAPGIKPAFKDEADLLQEFNRARGCDLTKHPDGKTLMPLYLHDLGGHVKNGDLYIPDEEYGIELIPDGMEEDVLIFVELNGVPCDISFIVFDTWEVDLALRDLDCQPIRKGLLCTFTILVETLDAEMLSKLMELPAWEVFRRDAFSEYFQIDSLDFLELKYYFELKNEPKLAESLKVNEELSPQLLNEILVFLNTQGLPVTRVDTSEDFTTTP